MADRLRTIAYVDGFNLYFGCLKRAPRYRWLDVTALVSRLCHDQNPHSEIVAVKFFSAPIQARLSPRGIASCNAQRDYWLALRAHSSCLEIVEGGYVIVPGSYHPDPSGGPIDFGTKLRVLRPEEKRTDVNIALHLLEDAIDDRCDQQVLFSNDSDCAPALQRVRRRCPEIRLGVVSPILKNVRSDRQPSRELRAHSDWGRSVITEDELAACQLPERVMTRKRGIRKPAHWK